MPPEMTPHEIANEIGVRQIQSRIYGEGETFVMVEGKTDHVLWEEYRAKEDCTLYPAQGKDKIIAALDITKKRGLGGVAGIVDADYWLITDAKELGSENLLYDDCCPDMESLLLDSDALKKVLRHSIDIEDIEEIHGFAEKLVTEARRIASEFGYFRLLNHLTDYWLHCNSIRFDEVIDYDKLGLDSELVASKLAGDKPAITAQDLMQQVDELRDKYPSENPQLCRGKDIVAIISVILPILFKREFEDESSTATAPSTKAKALSKDLRMAYEYGYFLQTSLYSCIRSWESSNTPYKILKPKL